MSEHHHHSLTSLCRLPNASRVLWSVLCSFLAPFGTQSEEREAPYRATSHTEPPPNRTPHSLFPVLSIHNSNSSPKNADLWLLHDLICRLLPLLPGIHPHYVWLDLQECTKLHLIVRGQPPWELSSLQPQLEGWYSSIGRVIASPNEYEFHLIKRWKKLNQYRVHNLEGWSQKQSVGFVNQVKIQEAELSTGRAASGDCTVRKPLDPTGYHTWHWRVVKQPAK